MITVEVKQLSHLDNQLTDDEQFGQNAEKTSAESGMLASFFVVADLHRVSEHVLTAD